MHGLRQRRGQGGPISVMILVAATLVVALMLYAYFAGIYSAQSARMGLVDQLALYSNRISVYSEASLIGESPGGDSLYCDVVSLVNRGGDPLQAYISILPVARTASGYTTNDGVLYVPVDYFSPYSPVPLRTVYAWILNDTDGDGVIEMLGNNGTGISIVYDGIASCETIFQWFTIGNMSDLPLPPGVDDPNLGFLASSLMLSTDGPSLQELAQAMVNATPDTMYVPMWNVTIPAASKVQLYFYTMSQEPQYYRALIIAVQFEGNFYVATIHPLGGG